MKRENPLLNILVNIFLPAFILRRGSQLHFPNATLVALLVALSLPVLYAAYDYSVRRKKNWISLIGLINILLTGVLALGHFAGQWFAIKDAAFPALLGVGIFISSFTKTPFMSVMTEQILNQQKIESYLTSPELKESYRNHLKVSTQFFSISLFISAVLNFIVASRIFLPIDQTLDAVDRSRILNEQISHMTLVSFGVILVPLFLFSGLVFWHLFNGIKKLTGLQMNDCMIES